MPVADRLPAPAAAVSATEGRSRRELTAAVLLCALAGALALSSSSQPWLRVTVGREPPLPPTVAVLTGGEAAPLVSGCGLLLLAAAVAVLAVRGAGRIAVGLLVAVAGGVVGWSGLRGATGRLGLDLTDVGAGVGLAQARLAADPVVGWATLALVAGVLGVLAGLLVVLRGRSWPGMARRYERTGAGARPATASARTRPETAEDRHQAAWTALDRGDDPTV